MHTLLNIKGCPMSWDKDFEENDGLYRVYSWFFPDVAENILIESVYMREFIIEYEDFGRSL